MSNPLKILAVVLVALGVLASGLAMAQRYHQVLEEAKLQSHSQGNSPIKHG